jgi:hypothetical protein
MAWFAVSINLGAFVPLMLGIIVPDKGSEEELTSKVWMIVLGFPILLYIGGFVLLLVVIRFESPKFLAV